MPRWYGEARPENDYARVLPYLEEVLNLSCSAASAKAAAADCSPYEALLDEYEAGGRTDRIDALFADLTDFLPSFLEIALGKQSAGVKPSCLRARSIRNASATRSAVGVLGFDFDSGRLDVACTRSGGGVPGDVRITTRYTEDNFTQSLMGVLHETGHALYEMGLPADWHYQPVGSARGMALHESQPLLIEMQACRSREYLCFAAPLMREAFGGSGPEWEVENLYRLYTHVERSFIRVDADEVTYPAHVILRYRLERALIDGDLPLADLPGAWNDAMEDLLGIRPPDARQGCCRICTGDGAQGILNLHDGAMAAAQLFAAAAQTRNSGSDRGGRF